MEIQTLILETVNISHVSMELQKQKWKFGRKRNVAVSLKTNDYNSYLIWTTFPEFKYTVTSNNDICNEKNKVVVVVVGT